MPRPVGARAIEAIAAIATDEDELSSARDLFKENALVGRGQVDSGNLDCDRVDSPWRSSSAECSGRTSETFD